MIRRNQLRICLLLLCVATFGMAAPAGAIPGAPITGRAADVLDRSLGNVVVADSAGNETLTDSNGQYELERSVGTVTFWAYRYGLVAQQRVVDPVTALSPVDFSMEYVLGASLSDSTVSTANGPATVTLRLTSYAPLPGVPGQSGGRSCVYVTDSRISGRTVATYAGPSSGGASNWDHVIELPQATPEATYALTFVAEDCATGQRLSNQPPAVTYTIDNTAPTITPLVPLDGGDVEVDVFRGKGVLIQGLDELTSVDPRGLAFELADLTAGTDAVHLDGTLESNGVIRSSSVTPMAGHDYRITATIGDLAGNVAVSTIAFTVLDIEIPTVTVSINSTTESSETDVMAAQKTFTWQDVEVTVPEYAFDISGIPSSDGIGYISRTVDLSRARIDLYRKGLSEGEWIYLSSSAAPRMSRSLLKFGDGPG